MAGWNPIAPQVITAKAAPLVADAIAFPRTDAGVELEIMFIVTNPGPVEIRLTWGSGEAGAATLPSPLPMLVIPPPADGEPTVQFGPFNNRQQKWFLALTIADPDAPPENQVAQVDVYTSLPARR